MDSSQEKVIEETTGAKRAAKKWKLRQENQDKELEQLVRAPGGAYFIWRLLCECGLYQAGDPTNLAIHEGRRQIGIWLLEELTRKDERLYSRVRNEGAKRDRGDE